MANRKKQIKREQQQFAAFKLELQRQKEQKKAGVKRMIKKVLQATSLRHLNGLQNTRQMKNLFCKKRELEQLDSNDHAVFMQLLKQPEISFSSLDYYERLLLCFCEVTAGNSIETLEMPKTDDESELFVKLFFHLFVKYDIPKCIERDIYSFAQGKGTVNTKLLFHIVNGWGLHHFESKVELNAKGNFYFNQAPEMLNTKRAICWAKTRAQGYSEKMTNRLVIDYKMSETQINDICNDDFFSFLHRLPTITERALRDVLKFFKIQRGRGQKVYTSPYGRLAPIFIEPIFPNFSLKGRTLASVYRLIDKWNKHVELKKELHNLKDLKASNVQPFKKYENGRCITIEQILRVDDLAYEGLMMQHCVGTYAHGCIKGNCSIWSMSLFFEDGRTHKLLTIELNESNKKIAQVKGKCNRLPALIECNLIKEWAAKENLIF